MHKGVMDLALLIIVIAFNIFKTQIIIIYALIGYSQIGYAVVLLICTSFRGGHQLPYKAHLHTLCNYKMPHECCFNAEFVTRVTSPIQSFLKGR